ncbi:MAG: DUF6599 family protein, partial [Desulfocapsaceae bacterium]
MNIYSALLLFAALSFHLTAYAADTFNFPDSIGSDSALTRMDDVRTWDPDNMYEHVNGEAELLKRYGAIGLAFVSYENNKGDYLSIDVLDMQKPINAYGLYRLYAGCDGSEHSFSEATVLADEYAPHALFGRYFFRFNVDIGEDTAGGEELVDDFLKQFISSASDQPPLPLPLAILQQKALQPCEVNYHPEHVDYDLESGPGYTWVGPDQQSYFITIL